MTMPARVVVRTCRTCGCWPCRCGLEPDEGSYTFPLRIARCTCGGPAIASGGGVRQVAAAIRAHQGTPEHLAWRDREGL